MTRPKRIDPPGGWHHVMSRGVNHDVVFFEDDDRLLFGRLLSTVSERFDVEVHAHCLMSNHFHLLVHCPAGGLSDAMQHLLSVQAQTTNDRIGRSGHLFTGRFVSRLITNEDYLANVVRYIHRNPLDIVGVDHPADYRWSSHRHYLGREPTPDWLRVEQISKWFSDTTAFDRFVSGSATSPVSIPNPAVAEELLRAVDLLLRERRSASARHVPAQRRAIAIGALPHLDEAARTAVCSSLGLVAGSSAYQQALSRAIRLLNDEVELPLVLERALELFGSDGALGAAA
jgi:REP element-mobilizing transposase RayT